MLSQMLPPSKVTNPDSQSATSPLQLGDASPSPLDPLDNGDTDNMKQLVEETLEAMHDTTVSVDTKKGHPTSPIKKEMKLWKDEGDLAAIRQIKSAPLLRIGSTNSPPKQHIEDKMDDELSSERITVRKFRGIMNNALKSYDVDGIADDLESPGHPGMISLRSIPKYMKRMTTLEDLERKPPAKPWKQRKGVEEKYKD